MSSLLTIGECMLELRKASDGGVTSAFAGDTYNSAVYAKRFSPDIKVGFLTALGLDPFSADMLKTWQQEQIDTSLVATSQTRNLGIYSVSTDEQGERSFAYWRKESAATDFMQLIEETHVVGANYDCIYFSGITLAILSDKDKHKLMDLIERCAHEGAKIAFDPNYRPAMWQNPSHARSWFETAYSLTDIAFPGLDDHNALYGHEQKQDIHDFLNGFDISLQIIKCQDKGVFAFSHRDLVHHEPFKPAPVQVDSTAAGDSFSGTFLSSMLSGKNIKNAVLDACEIASLVVQHPGAVIDKQTYKRHLER